MRKISLLLTFIFLLVTAQSGLAHRPAVGNGEESTLIPNATTSFAYYEELDAPDSIDIYQFEAQAGQFFHAGINIPQLDGLEDFGVTLALLGPGLPALNISQLPFENTSPRVGPPVLMPEWARSLGITSPAGIIQESTAGEPFFEPFTQTRYWGRQMLELDLPETGTYTLLVWNPDHMRGKYVLDTGTQEVFEPADLFRFPIWWLNTRLYFEQGDTLTALAAVTGILGLLGLRAARWQFAFGRLQ